MGGCARALTFPSEVCASVVPVTMTDPDALGSWLKNQFRARRLTG